MTGFEARGQEDLKRLAGALKEAGDKGLTNRVRASMRGVAKPVGVRVLHAGAAEMPHRGGFSSRVEAQGRAGLATALVSGTLHVTLTLSNKGADLKSLDAGILRHPVFARGTDRKQWTWRKQDVPEGTFTRAFEGEAPAVSRSVLAAADATLATVARKA